MGRAEDNTRLSEKKRRVKSGAPGSKVLACYTPLLRVNLGDPATLPKEYGRQVEDEEAK